MRSGAAVQALDTQANRLTAPVTSPLVSAGGLDPRRAAGLLGGEVDAEHYAPGEVITAAAPPQMKWVLDGWLCEARVLEDGRRQIFSFAVPGDIVETPPTRSRTATALTSVKCVDVGQLLSCTAEVDEVLGAVSHAVASASARRYDHLARLWERSALVRLGSLLVELHDRLDRIGQVRGGEFALPLRHEDLADALGLSTVHVTRCFKALRRRGLATMKFRRVSGFARAELEKLRD